MSPVRGSRPLLPRKQDSLPMAINSKDAQDEIYKHSLEADQQINEVDNRRRTDYHDPNLRHVDRSEVQTSTTNRDTLPHQREVPGGVDGDAIEPATIGYGKIGVHSEGTGVDEPQKSIVSREQSDPPNQYVRSLPVFRETLLIPFSA